MKTLTNNPEKPVLVYKITSLELKSCCAQPEAAIQYKVGEFVKPHIPFSKIVVFSHKKHALTFNRDYPRGMYKLWRARAKGVSQIDPLHFTYADNILSEMERIWKEGGIVKMNLPDGTIGCEELMLEKEIPFL